MVIDGGVELDTTDTMKDINQLLPSEEAGWNVPH